MFKIKGRRFFILGCRVFPAQVLSTEASFESFQGSGRLGAEGSNRQEGIRGRNAKGGGKVKRPEP